MIVYGEPIRYYTYLVWIADVLFIALQITFIYYDWQRRFIALQITFILYNRQRRVIAHKFFPGEAAYQDP